MAAEEELDFSNSVTLATNPPSVCVKLSDEEMKVTRIYG